MKKIKEMLHGVNTKNALLVGTGALTAIASVVPAFAVDTPSLPSIAITTDMLKPLVDSVVANISVILPVGIALFGVFLGIKLVPMVFSKFAH